VNRGTQPDSASYVGATQVTLSGLEAAESRYAFRVRSRAGHAHSSWSDVLHALIVDEPPLGQCRFPQSSATNPFLVLTTHCSRDESEASGKTLDHR
jgi:hypothetical protein